MKQVATRRAIYDFVRENASQTKRSISTSLNLSLPTVNKYMAYFLTNGLMVPSGVASPGASGGRNATTYACAPDGRLAVGVDVTKQSVRVLIVDLERQVVFRKRFSKAFKKSEEYYKSVARMVDEVIAESEVEAEKILGVGIAMPGLVSVPSEVVTYGAVIGNEGVSVGDFSRHIPYETRLLHDSDCAGLAEFWPGVNRGNAFYINLNRSIGGSMIINGTVYQGDGEISAEIGHVRIHTDGKLCYCGKYGCMDAYCNSQVLMKNQDDSLEAFFDCLSRGEGECVETWDRYTSDLARAINNVRMLFGSKVILGGDVGSRLVRHMGDIHAKVDALDFLNGDSRTYLHPCDYRDNPVATGAALHLVDAFREKLGPANTLS